MARPSPGMPEPVGSENRRDHERAHAAVPMAAVHDGLIVHIEGRNISEGGAYCQSAAYFDVMTRMAVSIELPAHGSDLDPDPVHIEAVVVRCEPHAWYPGLFNLALFFPSLEQSVRKRIASFVRSRHVAAPDGEIAPSSSDS